MMKVRDGMTTVVLAIGPAHTLREASRLMSARRVGAAVVMDPEHSGVGILTERDILDSIGAGQDPDTEIVAWHRTDNLVVASPDWTLEQAAHAMIRGNFRHLVVIDHGEVAGLLSMRDIVRSWTPVDVPGVAATASA
ncbi:MAG TPA: CBS domain-containing protein [Streptosporangiaceae bacterium]|nr:CBS domain-containing protein [Streptosporangiaceae bacterium]